MTEPNSAALRRKLIAPLWHTAVFVVFFLALGAAGLLFQRSGSATLPKTHPNVIPLYLSLLAAEWGLVYYVWQGLRRTGTRLGDVIGGRWSSPKSVATDLLLGLALGFLWIGVDKAWGAWLGPGHAKSIGALLPQSAEEIALWIAVSLSAGICEETVFRGYLQKQLTVLTRSGIVAVILQAIVFGAAHAYQGVNAAENTAAYGLALGALALWRGDVRPGIVAHAWSDIFGGVLSRIC